MSSNRTLNDRESCTKKRQHIKICIWPADMPQRALGAPGPLLGAIPTTPPSTGPTNHILLHSATNWLQQLTGCCLVYYLVSRWLGGGGGGCGRRGKPMSPRNSAAARGCCERREKSTSEDAGLRGRRLKGALPVYLSSVMRSLFILVFAGFLLCSRTCGALSYTH